MLAKSIFPYFFFGTAYRFLQDVESGQRIHGNGYVFENLQSVFNYFERLDLQITRRAARDLEGFKSRLEESEKDSVLSKEQSLELRRLMKELRNTLEAELEGFEAYIVTPKRYDVGRLTKDTHELFAEGVFFNLPEVGAYDFWEAGKCIAFERTTAAAFHILRGTEAVLRYYYCYKVKRKRCDMTWGAILTDLRKRRNSVENITLLNNLDNIRHSFRNPTQHPEKIYDIEEVQDLWGLCVDVVNRMTKQIHPVIKN